MSNYTIPGGRSKGTPLSSADEESLTYWIGAKNKRLFEDPDHQWADKDRDWVKAAEAELKSRAGGGTFRFPADTQGAQPAKPRPLTREGIIYAAIQGTAAYNTDPYEIARQAVAIADGILELVGSKP